MEAVPLVPTDEGTIRAVCTVVGAIGGAAVTGFFKWILDRAKMRGDDDRYNSIVRWKEEVDEALTKCQRRETRVRVQNARQQVEIDNLRLDIKELQLRIQELTGLKAGTAQESTTTVQEHKGEQQV